MYIVPFSLFLSGLKASKKRIIYIYIHPRAKDRQEKLAVSYNARIAPQRPPSMFSLGFHHKSLLFVNTPFTAAQGRFQLYLMAHPRLPRTENPWARIRVRDYSLKNINFTKNSYDLYFQLYTKLNGWWNLYIVKRQRSFFLRRSLRNPSVFTMLFRTRE